MLFLRDQMIFFKGTLPNTVYSWTGQTGNGQFRYAVIAVFYSHTDRRGEGIRWTELKHRISIHPLLSRSERSRSLRLNVDSSGRGDWTLTSCEGEGRSLDASARVRTPKGQCRQVWMKGDVGVVFNSFWIQFFRKSCAWYRMDIEWSTLYSL